MGRRWVAGAATLLAVLAGAPLAWGDGAWSEIGIGNGPVNHDPTQNADSPSLASVNGNSDPGALYLTWREAATLNGSSVDQIRAASLGPSPAVSRPWNELLASGQFSLNLDATHEARDPQSAVVGGKLTVAWIESDGSADQIHVAQWSGSAWNRLGSASPINTDTPVQISLTDVSGTPYIAYTQGTGADIFLYIKQFNGTNWVQVGSGDLNSIANYPGGVASDPQITNIEGVPYVAWTFGGTSDPAAQTVIQVDRYDSGTSAWVEVGSGFSPISTSGTDHSEHPSIADVGGTPYVAWSEINSSASSQDVYVSRFTGGTWSMVGGSVNENTHAPAREPSLTDVRGTPYVAWVERPIGDTHWQLYTASFDGSQWRNLGPPLNHDTAQSADQPDLIDTYTYSDCCGGYSDTPAITWDEPDSDGHMQIRSAAYGTPPQNTARPQLSGTPQNGQTLSCTHGTWSASGTISYTVVWERGARSATSDSDPSWTPISGETGDTYMVRSTDDGLRVRCLVGAASGFVSAQAVSTSKRTDAGAPSFNGSGYPRVDGTRIVGQPLTCNPGPLVTNSSQPGWHNFPDFSYQWTKNGQPIPGATAAAYTPTVYHHGYDVIDANGDGDHQLGCTVTGTNDLGHASLPPSATVHELDTKPVNLLFTAPPAVTVVPDDPAHPSPLAESVSCGHGLWFEDDGGYGYQWLRTGTPITGATSATYRVTVQDLGRELACRVIDTNLVGPSDPATSPATLIPLPTGANDISTDREGGTNQVDPTNLLPITHRYQVALQAYTISRLQSGIATATAACRIEQARERWPSLTSSPAVHVPFQSEEDRCRVLLGDPSNVQAYPSGGVRWIHGNCTPFAGLAAATHEQLCADLDIQVTPIDPQKPPEIGNADLAAVAPATPAEILWDLNGDGRTDAICPASAPVLSTIFEYDRTWHPHVVIIDQDGSVNTGDITFNLGTAVAAGALRPSQVRVCMTSFDPPPTPQLPCVTAGQIGSIQVSNANLCPIDARQINASDFDQLLSSDLKTYLLAASESELSSSGTLTSARDPGSDGGPLKTTYVSWPSTVEPPGEVAVKPAHGLHAVDATQAIATGSAASGTIAAATGSALASLTSENSPLHYALLNPPFKTRRHLANGVVVAAFRGFLIHYDPSKAGLAYNQIYLARGPGQTPGTARDGAAPDLPSLNQAANAADSIVPGVTGDTGQALLNGVGLSAAPDAAGQATGMLLIGSDVAGALPAVKSFTLTGRNLAPTLGLPTDPKALGLPTDYKAVALGEAHAMKDELIDDAKTQASQELNDVAGNLDQMTQDYQKQGAAYGQDLLDRVQKSLDVGPFKFGGDAHLKLNPDGTATLTVNTSLPGLTGSGPKTDSQGKPVLDDEGNPVPVDGSPVTGEATFHADQHGQIALRGVHITAQAAFFLGISLKGLDLTYDSTTGFDLKAQILIQALGNAGIDIKNFQLDKDGKFEDLAVDYLAGAGTGIPVFPGIEMTRLGFDLNTAISKFSADVGVTVGTSVGGGCVPLGAIGTVSVQLYQPVEVKGSVDPQIFCLPFGDITFDAKGDGTVSLIGHWGLHADLVDFDIGLGAEFGGSDSIDPGAFQVYAHGDGSIVGVLKGLIDAVISNRGLAACGSIDVTIPIVGDILSVFTGSRTIHIAAGAAEDFKHGVPLTAPQILAALHLFTGCDIGSYYPLGKPTFTATDAGAGVQTFRLPADRGPTLVSFVGAGHAPRFTLRSPNGQTYAVTQTGQYGSRLAHGAWGSIVDPASETVVILPNPPGGLWTAQLAPGSAQILRVDAAPILPPPAVKAHVSGRGSRRVLHYALVREPGQTVRISEQATGENHLLGTLGASSHERLQRGTIRYTVGEASSRARRIVADVYQNGVPRKELLLARYNASNPTVASVRGLRVRHSGKRALITWRPGALDRRYYVRVTYGDGQVVLGGTGHTRFDTQRLSRGEGLRVVVYAQSAAGRSSRAAKTSLKGSMLVGSVHQVAPYKPPKPKPKHKKKPKKKPKPKHK